MYDNKIKLLRQLANADSVYRNMKERYAVLEEAFSQITLQLPEEEQDILWAFVLLSDEMDRRLLEIACDYIRFGD